MAKSDHSMSNAGFAFFIGLLFLSGAMGTLHGVPVGCIIFGGGMMMMGLGEMMLAYLDKKK